jgi:hypothetical protein
VTEAEHHEELADEDHPIMQKGEHHEVEETIEEDHPIMQKGEHH